MLVSLSEIQTIIYRSGLAINLPSGIAKDNSFAARRMLLESFCSLNVFVDAFDSFRKNFSVGFDIEETVKGQFLPVDRQKKLSSLLVSPSVCDLLSIFDVSNNKKIKVSKLDEPLILLFHILELSKKLNRDFQISFNYGAVDSIIIVCTSNGLFNFSEKKDFLENHRSGLVVLENFNPKKSLFKLEGVNQIKSDFFIEDDVWVYFAKYSDLLLVEDSDRSRINNAGSGLSDND